MNLREKLIKKIKKPIRIDKFISFSLFDKNSYYLSQNPIGQSKDFITSPEISQLFGEILGAYILNYWIKNIKSSFNLIELGPGKGTLLNDILKTAKLNNNFIKNVDIKLIEKNQKLIKIQKENFDKLNLKKIKWLEYFKINNNKPSIIYSNEFFDCLPIRQFYKKSDWYEKFVKYDKDLDIFSVLDKKVTSAKDLKELSSYEKYGIAELSHSREKIFQTLCKHIVKNKGIIILIDYGYKDPIRNFTLQFISRHKKTHIFENIGEQDISSLVNFEKLINITSKYKLKVAEFCTQKDFLISNGIITRKNFLKKNTNEKEKRIIEEGFDILTNNNKMGKHFKVLIISSL